MSLYIRNPESIIEARRRMMRKMLENSFNTERVLSIPMEMKVSEDDYRISAFLPGISAEEVSIQFNNGVLTVEGEYGELQDEQYAVRFSDFPVGKFSRSVEIDEPVLSDKIEASMKDGVLTIRVPKAEEAKPRSIKINAK
jgi:HSP20 family protein